MNAKVKEKWLAALRSGNYKQGQKVLKQGAPGEVARYCCLGVLCDLAVDAGVVTSDLNVAGSGVTDRDGRFINNVWAFFGLPEDINESTLPLAVRDWAGLDGGNPSVPVNRITPGYPTNLASLNDAYNATFADIADIIEEYL